jgi:hypothetical protein
MRLEAWYTKSNIFHVNIGRGVSGGVGKTLQDALRRAIEKGGGQWDEDSWSAVEAFLRKHPESEQVGG